MWSGTGYTGEFTYWANSVPPYTPENQWLYVGGAYNDWANALYNHRQQTSYISADYPPSANWYALATQEAVSNLDDYTWEDGQLMGDTISSFNLFS